MIVYSRELEVASEAIPDEVRRASRILRSPIWDSQSQVKAQIPLLGGSTKVNLIESQPRCDPVNPGVPAKRAGF